MRNTRRLRSLPGARQSQRRPGQAARAGQRTATRDRCGRQECAARSALDARPPHGQDALVRGPCRASAAPRDESRASLGTPAGQPPRTRSRTPVGHGKSTRARRVEVRMATRSSRDVDARSALPAPHSSVTPARRRPVRVQSSAPRRPGAKACESDPSAHRRRRPDTCAVHANVLGTTREGSAPVDASRPDSLNQIRCDTPGLRALRPHSDGVSPRSWFKLSRAGRVCVLRHARRDYAP